jgi:hypothetical protein
VIPPTETRKVYRLAIKDEHGIEDPNTLRRLPKNAVFETSDAALAEKLIAAERAVEIPSRIRIQALSPCLVGSRVLSRGEIAEVDHADAGPAVGYGLARALAAGHRGWPLDLLPRDPRVPRGHPFYEEREAVPMVDVMPRRAGAVARVIFTVDQLGTYVPVREDLAVECFANRTWNRHVDGSATAGPRAVSLKASAEKTFSPRGLKYLKTIEEGNVLAGTPYVY